VSSQLLSRKKVFSKLEEAMLEHTYIRVVRAYEADAASGFVVAIGEDWFLLRSMNRTLDPDGWTAMRIADVASVKKDYWKSAQEFEPALMKAAGAWPPAAPVPCDLSSFVSLVATAQQASPLVAVHKEHKHPTYRWFGRVTALDDEHVTIYQASVSARWTNTKVFKNRSVTRIEFGDLYGRNLARIMEPMPTD